MINKNFSDIAKMANALTHVADEFKRDEIKFSLNDIEVRLVVSETELSIIDRELFEITKGNNDKEYTPAKTVKANVGGITFVITSTEYD